MANSGGFPYAQLDTALLSDAKVRRLARLLPDARDFYAGLGVFSVMVAAIWRTGSREPTTDDECEDAPPEIVAAVKKCKLLDSDGRVPVAAFDKWVGEQLVRRRAEADRKRRTPPDSAGIPRTPPDSAGTSSPTRSVPPDSAGLRRSDADSSDSTSFLASSTELPSEERAREEEPEGEAITWLAVHGCYVRPGNGYHRQLIAVVEHHGINAVIGMFDRLAKGGTTDGDIKGFIFGAKDALDARTRPDLTVVAKEEERAEDRSRREAASKRQLAELGRYIDEEPMPEEQRTANLARLRSEMAAKGLIS